MAQSRKKSHMFCTLLYLSVFHILTCSTGGFSPLSTSNDDILHLLGESLLRYHDNASIDMGGSRRCEAGCDMGKDTTEMETWARRLGTSWSAA